jgi:hypothetical protein
MADGRLSAVARRCLVAALAGTACMYPAASEGQAARQSASCEAGFRLSGPADMSRLSITMNNDGGSCGSSFGFNFPVGTTMPEAVVSVPPVSGTVKADITDGGENVLLAYRPNPGFTGTDGFIIVFNRLPQKVRAIRAEVTVTK